MPEPAELATRPVNTHRHDEGVTPDTSSAALAVVLRLQASAGNRAVSALLTRDSRAVPAAGALVVQRTWEDKGGGKYFENESNESYDANTKKLTDASYKTRTLTGSEHIQLMMQINADVGDEDEAPVIGDQQPVGGGRIDFAEVRRVLEDYYNDGDEMPSKQWKKMRQELSDAVTLPNKSHPAHGSNFNMNQRALPQVKDWWNPLPVSFKESLRPVFNAQFGANAF